MLIEREAAKKFGEALNSGKIVVLTGARQVGKTTLVQQILGSERLTMLNFDLPFDVSRFQAAAVLPPADGYRILGSPDYLVIDEIQREPAAFRMVKGWYDAGFPAEIVLLGSSSLNLLSQTAESLTGRNRKITLPPLTMLESLTAENWYNSLYPDTVLDKEMSAQFRIFLMKNMVFGSYPEVVAGGDRGPLLRNLAGDYLWKDLLQNGALRTPELLRRLLGLLAYQIGSEISVNEIAQQLAMSRQTVERYLDLLEETFVIFRLSSFSTNPRKEIVKGKKVFFWDTGIRNAVLNSFDLSEQRPDLGALFENYVIAEIKKRSMLRGENVELFFWRSKGNSEVDLVLQEEKRLQAFEIKWKRRRSSSRSFENTYQVPVTVLTSENPSIWPLS